LAREDALVGTLAYMAPELRDGARQPDPRTDLYSVGVVLFEMLTGERPAGAELPSTVRANAPANLDDIFRKLYARYDGRFASAREVLDALAPAQAAPPPPSRTPVPPPPPRGTKRVGLKYCPSCQHVVDPDDQYCTQCRHQLVEQVRRCPSCHAYPGANDRFCIFCGTVLRTAD